MAAVSETIIPVIGERVVHGVCPHDCPDTCSFHVTVRDGVAVKIKGDASHP